MEKTAVLRLISLIPDRVSRSQSGSTFVGTGAAGRAQLLAPFLSWLGPLNPISKEEQQILGVRSGGGKALVDGEAAGEEVEEAADRVELADEVDDSPIRLPGTGTQIAA
ncbi:MAG TPA: hypothetical protein VIG70_08375 [Burkholderiales bacterium]|jgi:hypothetical protein